jgi:hypothetical protein
MNNRPVSPELTQRLYTQIQNKLQEKEHATGSDVFMLCMAVGRGLGRKFREEDLPRANNLIY